MKITILSIFFLPFILPIKNKLSNDLIESIIQFIEGITEELFPRITINTFKNDLHSILKNRKCRADIIVSFLSKKQEEEKDASEYILQIANCKETDYSKKIKECLKDMQNDKNNLEKIQNEISEKEEKLSLKVNNYNEQINSQQELLDKIKSSYIKLEKSEYEELFGQSSLLSDLLNQDEKNNINNEISKKFLDFLDNKKLIKENQEEISKMEGKLKVLKEQEKEFEEKIKSKCHKTILNQELHINDVKTNFFSLL